MESLHKIFTSLRMDTVDLCRLHSYFRLQTVCSYMKKRIFIGLKHLSNRKQSCRDLFAFILFILVILLTFWLFFCYLYSYKMQKIELQKGNYYTLVQTVTDRALMMNPQASRDYTNKVPSVGKTNDEDLNQVWMIQFITERNAYEIVHALSTLVMENFVKSIKLTYGDWKKGQLFWIERSTSNLDSNCFVISEKKGSNSYFYADSDGILQFGEKDPNAKEILWTLRIAQKTRAITQSVIFENAYTNMIIDVPGASSKQGEGLVQYPVNKRFNQRFKLVYYENGNFYHIENVKSGLVMDITGGSKKEGALIIQWTNKNGENQRWYIQNQGKDLYLIRSAMAPELFIGIKNNSSKECAQLVTTKSEQFALWRILGEFKKQQFDLV